MATKFFSNIHMNPIIAAVNDLDNLDKALNSPSQNIFLLTGSILNLKYIVKKVKDNNKGIFIHIDLIDGFSKDCCGIEYIMENMKPDGIITTKSNLIKVAKELNIFAIQRLFALDSLSLDSGIKSIKCTRPNAVEILPGIIPKIIKKLHNELQIPIITGGLIKDKVDVIESLNAGAVAISTSNENVWYM